MSVWSKLLSRVRGAFAPPRALPAPSPPATIYDRLDALAAPAIVQGGGWANPMSGMGMVGVDQAESTVFAGVRRLEHDAAFAIYRGDKVAARLVDLPVWVALHRGWRVVRPGEDALEDPLADELVALGAALPWGEGEHEVGIEGALARWLRWGMVGRGSGLYLHFDDDAPASPRPRGARLVALRVIPSHKLNRWTRNGLWSAYDGALQIHPERLICYGLSNVPEGLAGVDGSGWGESIYVGLYESLRSLATSRASIPRLVSTAVLDVLQVADLREALAEDPDAVNNRIAYDHLLRSIHRQSYVDRDLEGMERLAAPLSGVSDVVRVSFEILAAEAGWPVTLLMGQSPAGLSTDDASGARNWRDLVAATIQAAHVERALRAVYGAILEGPDAPFDGPFEVAFNPFDEPDPKADERDALEREKLRAEVRAIYANAQAVDPAALNRPDWL